MTRREAYLDALGLTDWVRRDAQPAGHDKHAGVSPAQPSAETGVSRRQSNDTTGNSPSSSAVVTAEATVRRSRVLAGPGDGSCLYLCGPDDDESTPLASDLGRILTAPPVWGRLADGAEGQPLELLIAERLFTQVVVFGEASAQRVFGGDAPPTCGPARVTVVDDLRRLGGDAGARRSCWSALKAAGVVTVS